HLDNSRRHDAAPVSATVPNLWLAHHLVSKVEKTGRLRCIYNAHCRDEVQDGLSVTREWFTRLRVIMGADWDHFSELDELLAETRNG
uniref:hypothetical protein n=1 Tax=Sphingomonas sp. MMO-176 TaxID=3081299 RepID=UPI0030780F51